MKLEAELGSLLPLPSPGGLRLPYLWLMTAKGSGCQNTTQFQLNRGRSSLFSKCSAAGYLLHGPVQKHLHHTSKWTTTIVAFGQQLLQRVLPLS